MKRALSLFVLLSLPLGSACNLAYGWQDYQLRRVVRNLEKVRSFEGTLVEEGVVPDAKVKTDVVFARPNLFAARIAEPMTWAGTTVTYDGSTLVYHYPKLRYAVRIANLELPAGKRANEVVEYQYWKDVKAFDYRIYGSSRTAGLPTVTLWHTAKTDETFNRKGWNKVYDRYSFPLAGEMTFSGDVTYGYRYESIRFNERVNEATFSTSLPKGTIIAEWDLAAPAVTEPAMKKEATFALVLPDDNALELKRTRIVRAAGPLPAFCARYDRGAHFLLVVAHPSSGFSVPAYGLPIDTGTKGRLIIGPSTASYVFVHDGTYYTLLGNLPYEEILDVAKLISANGTSLVSTEAKPRPPPGRRR